MKQYAVEALGAGSTETTVKFETEAEAQAQFETWKEDRPAGTNTLLLTLRKGESKTTIARHEFIRPPRIRATLHGETLGWFDTPEEAWAAVEREEKRQNAE